MLGSIAQKFSTSQGARTLATLARRRHSARERARSHRALDGQPAAHGGGAHQRGAAGARGRSLAATLQDSGAFPDVAIKMVEVGESTGALQEMLNSLADFYDEERSTRTSGGSSP